MAERGAVIALGEELTCPICLAIYSNPVSLSCGHSFCKECVQGARRQQQCLQGGFSCPLCSAQTDPTAELKPNIQLCNIVQKFQDSPAQEGSESQCEEKGESSGQQDGLIRCDFCLQKPQPAVKTCLNCEVSLCQVHLGKHCEKSLLKDHVLMEPCDERVLAERKCAQHGKLLECYCKTDRVCICMLCCISSSHKNHGIVPLEEAYSEAQRAFPKTLETVRKCEAALNQCIAGLLKQEEQVKTEESLQRDHLASLFKNMHQQLDNKKEELLETLRHYEEKQLSRIQTQIEKQKEEKNAASRDVQELEALRDQKDVPIFVKAFTDLARKQVTVPKKSSVKLSKRPFAVDKVTTDGILALFQEFLTKMQSPLEIPVHEHLTTAVRQGVGLGNCLNIIYPSSLNPLYQDKPIFTSPLNTFYQNNTVFTSPLNPFYQDFTSVGTPTQYVPSVESFSEGCHFWEVDTSNARCWSLGIVQSGTQCYLDKTQNSLSVFQGQKLSTVNNPPVALKVVRVELNCRRNTLSFYEASVKDGDPDEGLELIETVKIPSQYPARATFVTRDGFLKLL